MPENTLLAFANHGMVGELMRPDGGDADLVLNRLGQAGTDVGALAATLQRDGAEAFVTSWKDLLSCLEAKSATLRDAALAGGRR
jgi:transaldolase